MSALAWAAGGRWLVRMTVAAGFVLGNAAGVRAPDSRCGYVA